VKRAALAVAVGLMGVSALPAAAHPTGHNSNHPTGRSCNSRSVAYVAHGMYLSSDLTQDPTTGVYSGTTIVVHVTSANHQASATKGNDVTFTIPSTAKVTVADDVTTAGGPGAGDQVTVKATITKLRKGCPTGSFTPTVTVKHVVVTLPDQTS
jgi:hypothetical protein